MASCPPSTCSIFGNLCNEVLGDDPPLVDELVWGHLLERHLDGGAYRHLVGRGAREIGIEIDPRVRVQVTIARL